MCRLRATTFQQNDAWLRSRACSSHEFVFFQSFAKQEGALMRTHRDADIRLLVVSAQGMAMLLTAATVVCGAVVTFSATRCAEQPDGNFDLSVVK